MRETSNTDNASNPDANEQQKKKRSELPRTLGFIITFAGVFFLVASFFSLITLFVLQATSGDSESMSANEINSAVLTIFTILVSLSAIFIGIKLIKHLDIGRKLFNICTVVVIVLVWGKYIYQQNEIAKSFVNIPPELAAGYNGIELSDALTVVILPLILIVIGLLLNLGASKKSLSH